MAHRWSYSWYGRSGCIGEGPGSCTNHQFLDYVETYPIILIEHRSENKQRPINIRYLMIDTPLPIDVPVIPLSEDFSFIMLICLLTGSLTGLRCKDTIQSKHLVRAVISAEFMSVWILFNNKHVSSSGFSVGNYVLFPNCHLCKPVPYPTVFW